MADVPDPPRKHYLLKPREFECVNAVTFVYGIAGMAMFTSAFTWMMWFVIDDS